jgi:hypothetical protein
MFVEVAWIDVLYVIMRHFAKLVLGTGNGSMIPRCATISVKWEDIQIVPGVVCNVQLGAKSAMTLLPIIVKNVSLVTIGKRWIM